MCALDQVGISLVCVFLALSLRALSHSGPIASLYGRAACFFCATLISCFQLKSPIAERIARCSFVLVVGGRTRVGGLTKRCACVRWLCVGKQTCVARARTSALMEKADGGGVDGQPFGAVAWRGVVGGGGGK